MTTISNFVMAIKENLTKEALTLSKFWTQVHKSFFKMKLFKCSLLSYKKKLIRNNHLKII